ncbi:MAG: Bifunctional protein Aas [Chlamydiae bacterium]|nr:Bifunctional protein Aas [Chlamydiota bacterium]
MRKIIEGLLCWFVRIALWFRYRITVKGLEKLTPEALNRPGGVLFLPNHAAMGVDPLSIVPRIWKKYPVRPLIVEYMYYAPFIYPIMKYIHGIPVPNNEVSSNSVKKKRSDKAMKEAVSGLKIGENFLIYPSGRLKDTGYEFIGGASGAHRIISENPECNLVLVRSVGFWGSSFSKAYTGKSPPFFPALWKGFLHTLKNFIFFNPRRHITLEFEPMPDDFPRYGTRLEMNRWLEEWYNRPEGLNEGDPDVIGEPLTRVSYSIWSKQYLEFQPPKAEEDDPEINLEKIPEETKNKVVQVIAELADVPPHTIKEKMIISSDLSLDSLDMAELVLFLDDEFDVKGVPVIELTTVGRMMAIADRQIMVTDEEEEHKDLSQWNKPVEKRRVDIAEGKTIPEVILNNAAIMGHDVCCADDRSGVLDYQRVKLAIVILAEYIRNLPGKHVGVLLPASVGATLTIMACQLAGKIPVVMNWTLGPRHLGAVTEATDIQRVISSWAFIDKLGNVDLDCIDDELIMLEDVKRDFSIWTKIKGALTSKKGTKALLKHFKVDHKDENDIAVILFTSGTESAPKGVPLSHRNILENLRSICRSVDVYTNDTFFGVLPPFHSFGLTAGCFFGPLTGMRVCYYPNPINGQGMAKGCEKWRPTVICAAPTFLKGMLKAGRYDQFTSARWVVSGAEAAPPELFAQMEKMGMGGMLKEGYGVTECSPVLTINRLDVESAGVGQPVDGVDIVIIHPKTHEKLPQGETGLIIARGPNVFSGYLNQMVASPFIDFEGEDWYNTGDLGYFDEINRLIISGRLKRFIKSGGEMISLGAIEYALLEAAPQKKWELAEEGPSVAVCGRERGDERAQIIAITIFPTSVEEVNSTLREGGFSNIVKVTDVMQLDEIPIMGSGKIFYRDLETKYMT